MRGFACLLLFLTSPVYSQTPPADTVMTGGAVYTVDAARSWATAVAIRGEEIVFVGADSQAEAFIGPETQRVSLEGRMVLPGFHDSHIHPIGAMLKQGMCSLSGLGSIEAYLEKIRSCAEADSDSSWLMGQGWSHALFSDTVRPDRKLLDSVVDDRPLTLTSYDGHSVWANSLAIERSGIDETTEDPPSGVIERYPESSVPSGLFLEDPAIKLVLAAKPDFSEEQRYQALLDVQKYLNSLGVTSVQDAWVELDNVGIYGTLPTYHAAARKDELTLRVVAAMYWQPDGGMEQLQLMEQARERYTHGLFRATSTKIWQDGVMHTHTSKLLEDYSDRPGERGMSMFSQDDLNSIVQALDQRDFQVHIHADGDGALREALDALEFSRHSNGPRDSRHHIAHLELVHEADIPRMRQLGVVANVQPLWSTSRRYIGDLIGVKLGEWRKSRMEINRSFLRNGVTVAYGSDWFVTSANPMDLLEAAVTRIRPALPLEDKRTAQPVLPGEEVTLAEAIASYTIKGAWANHQEGRLGSLEPGKLADVVVLEKNLFEVEPVRISEVRVDRTYLAGKLVYRREHSEDNDQ